MAPIITKEKIKEFLAAGNNIVIPNLSLVKDAAGAFSPLQLAGIEALFIATIVKVSTVYSKRQPTFLLTVHILRASGRARKSGRSSAAMSRRWLAKPHCDGR